MVSRGKGASLPLPHNHSERLHHHRDWLYRPRYPYSTWNIPYRYRLQTPNHTTDEICWVDFNTNKQLDNFNWNHLDHYICTCGDRDFAITESLKYWRLHLYFYQRSVAFYQLTTQLSVKEFLNMQFVVDSCSSVSHINYFLLFPPDFSTRASIASSTLTWLRRRGTGRLCFSIVLAATGSPIGATLMENKYLHQSTGDSGLFTDHQLSGDESIDVVVFSFFKFRDQFI